MREVISVHVGQAGVQIGNACCKSRVLLLRLRLCCWHGSNLTRLPRFFCFAFAFVLSDESPVEQGNSTRLSTA
jgi:hypothetical protein